MENEEWESLQKRLFLETFKCDFRLFLFQHLCKLFGDDNIPDDILDLFATL